jgi:hypothetical protein
MRPTFIGLLLLFSSTLALAGQGLYYGNNALDNSGDDAKLNWMVDLSAYSLGKENFRGKKWAPTLATTGDFPVVSTVTKQRRTWSSDTGYLLTRANPLNGNLRNIGLGIWSGIQGSGALNDQQFTVRTKKWDNLIFGACGEFQAGMSGVSMHMTLDKGTPNERNVSFPDDALKLTNPNGSYGPGLAYPKVTLCFVDDQGAKTMTVGSNVSTTDDNNSFSTHGTWLFFETNMVPNLSHMIDSGTTTPDGSNQDQLDCEDEGNIWDGSDCKEPGDI